MSTSNIQNRWQCYGPHRPTVREFINLLRFLPDHVEIQAIAIRGQGGGIVIEIRHDEMEQVYAFNENLEPTTEERL